jgi:high-affinity nickel-transport protein
MIGAWAFTVFVLGLRHGADPDHIAAIDNLTRNSFDRRPWLSRFCGTLFAAGHSVMVLAIAALVGIAGSRFATHGALIEHIGTWLSIIVLALIAGLNIAALRRGGTQMTGLKGRLLPAALRNGSDPWLALPIGALFGFGFETSSQIATYTLAFGAGGGIAGAMVVGSAFCLGMVCTDTLDSVVVHRLVSDRASLGTLSARIWVWSVSLIALVIAAYELAGELGWQSPMPDIYVSALIVMSLILVFGFLIYSTRRSRGAVAAPIQAPTAP